MSLAKIRIFKDSLFGLILGNYIIILVDDTTRCLNVTPRYYENLAKILPQKKPGDRAMTQPRLSEQATGWVI